MSADPTKLQQKIMVAMSSGKELTDMGRSYGIFMGEMRILQAGQSPVEVKTKILKSTVNQMVQKGLIRQVTKKRENGNSYLAFEICTQRGQQ